MFELDVSLCAPYGYTEGRGPAPYPTANIDDEEDAAGSAVSYCDICAGARVGAGVEEEGGGVGTAGKV